MKPSSILPGQVFGALTIIERSQHKAPKDSDSFWLVACECGTRKDVRGSTLRRGRVRSCGCKTKELIGAAIQKHGWRKHPLYRRWMGMIDRCRNKNHVWYERYGGRGICVCDRWQKSLLDFAADMGPMPNKKCSIERIDNDGDYTPGNCRWANQKEQCRNTRRNRNITVGNETFSVAEWSERTGIPDTAIYMRLHRGWNEEKAVTTPLAQRHRK